MITFVAYLSSQPFGQGTSKMSTSPTASSPATASGTSGSTAAKRAHRFHSLQDLLHQRLRQSGRRQLHEVYGHCDEAHCRLTGRVSTYHMKQLAQEIARRIDGIERIENQIRVVENRPPKNSVHQT